MNKTINAIEFIEFGKLSNNEMDSIRGGATCGVFYKCPRNRMNSCEGGYSSLFGSCTESRKW